MIYILTVGRHVDEDGFVLSLLSPKVSSSCFSSSLPLACSLETNLNLYLDTFKANCDNVLC